jgi:hypothetical protein
MLKWTLLLVSVCGTRAKSLFALFSSTLYDADLSSFTSSRFHCLCNGVHYGSYSDRMAVEL